MVRDADGRATPGAVVALVLATSYDDIEDKTALRPRATTVAADGGVFQFQQVPPGLYLLTATAQRWSPAERTNLSLLPGEAIGALELRLGRGGGHLRGRVADAGGGPIAGATVRALALGAAGRPEGARTFVAVGDGHGRYELLLWGQAGAGDRPGQEGACPASDPARVPTWSKSATGNPPLARMNAMWQGQVSA